MPFALRAELPHPIILKKAVATEAVACVIFVNAGTERVGRPPRTQAVQHPTAIPHVLVAFLAEMILPRGRVTLQPRFLPANGTTDHKNWPSKLFTN